MPPPTSLSVFHRFLAQYLLPIIFRLHIPRDGPGGSHNLDSQRGYLPGIAGVTGEPTKSTRMPRNRSVQGALSTHKAGGCAQVPCPQLLSVDFLGTRQQITIWTLKGKSPDWLGSELDAQQQSVPFSVRFSLCIRRLICERSSFRMERVVEKHLP
jgi:hypothetical protein